MNSVRWGLLSTANINRRLIPAIRASQRGELVAVASRDAQRVKKYASEWEIPRFFNSYEAMLEAEEIDAVYISLPNHMHAEWTIRALQAGKHVLCEKPFAISVEEVDRMIAASRESGRVLAEAFMYRHHPQTKTVSEWVREGRLGTVRLVRSTFSFFMQNREGNVRLVPEYGGGALWDVGIYPISFTRLIYGGLPETVTAQQWIGSTGVDEVFAGQLHYSDGRSAQIACGFSIPFQSTLEAHGDKGRISLNRPFTQTEDKEREVVFTPADGQAGAINTPQMDPYFGEVDDMHAAILDGAPPLVTLDESRDHVRMATALLEAARTGQMVRL